MKQADDMVERDGQLTPSMKVKREDEGTTAKSLRNQQAIKKDELIILEENDNISFQSHLDFSDITKNKESIIRHPSIDSSSKDHDDHNTLE